MSITFIKVPISVNDNESHFLFDILLPSGMNEPILYEIIDFMVRFRKSCASYQPKYLSSFLATFLESQPYLCFNYLYIPYHSLEEKTLSRMDSIQVGDTLFNVSSSRDELFIVKLAMTLMKQYIK